MATIIDGKAVAAALRAKVAVASNEFAARAGRRVGLSVVLVGDDPASHVYVRNKEKAAAEVGFAGEVHRLPADVSEDVLLARVRDLSNARGVDGILVQLPLPKHLSASRVILEIAPDKDVDGLHPVNQGRLLAGVPGLRPCTPVGCLRLCDHAGVELRGAEAVVVGRSALVGKPVALLLLERHATVTLCHSRTRDLGAVVGRADVVIAATGQPGLVRGEWIRDGAVVIDVGTTRLPSGKLAGDVEFEAASARARAITPVPGGVGPMTIACLLENAIRAAHAREGLDAPVL
jgi:methylenetetrahydrofolate dehydrogenase (NADP+)/methenyltetrahydrofolate cyclohydrolase